MRGLDRIFDFKNYYKAETVLYWHEDEWNKTIQNFGPTLYGRLFFNKDAQVIQQRKVFSVNDFETNGYPSRKK